MRPNVVDLDRPELRHSASTETRTPIICVSATGSARTPAAERCLEESMFGLTEAEPTDPRFVRVPSLATALTTCLSRVEEKPHSTAVMLDVLRSYRRHCDTFAGLVTESLAYSALQAGTEFAAWLSQQKPRRRHYQENPVVIERVDDRLTITFDRPSRHNAFSDALREGLLSGLNVAIADSSVTEVRLGGRGPSFCSGGDLYEFGLFADPVSSHLARIEHSPALRLALLRERLGDSLVADVHGAVLGSGLEMASYCGSVVAQPGSVFGLPELDLGLLPGAGGTVSVTRRIGTHRTAYLIVSGAQIDESTALDWGLIDIVEGS